MPVNSLSYYKYAFPSPSITPIGCQQIKVLPLQDSSLLLAQGQQARSTRQICVQRQELLAQSQSNFLSVILLPNQWITKRYVFSDFSICCWGLIDFDLKIVIIQLSPGMYEMHVDRKFILEKGDQPARTGQDLTSQQHLFFVAIEKTKRTQCDICRRNISNQARAMVQEDSTFKDYCMACFGNLDSLPQQYYIANKLDFPLFDPVWTAGEELLLFEGLQNHGFGNWNDISDCIGSKTREEVEEHYQNVYLSQQNFIPSAKILTFRNQDGVLIHPQKQQSQRQQRPPGQVQPKQNRALSQIGQANTPSEVVGFMPRRGDFQIEYDNDAQLLLAEMQFNDDDSQQEKAMKFRLIDIYNHKLTQRIKRKQFVIERKLLDIREQLRLDKTRTKEQKQIYNLMKVVARFSTVEEHQKLVQGIIKEKQLRQRIAELKELENKGIRTLAEVEEELEGKRRKDDRYKKREGENYHPDKSKTRRVARKDNAVERSDKKVMYISKEEEELCRSLNMTFRQYTAIKEIILREAVKIGLLDRDKTTQQLKIARSTAEIVYDFVVEQEGLLDSAKQKEEEEGILEEF